MPSKAIFELFMIEPLNNVSPVRTACGFVGLFIWWQPISRMLRSTNALLRRNGRVGRAPAVEGKTAGSARRLGVMCGGSRPRRFSYG